MIGSVGDALLDQVIDAELALLRPEVRASRDRLDELLDDDFVEIGASDRRWDRDTIIADLVESSSVTVTVEQMDARFVADQIALVTYETTAPDRRRVTRIMVA